MVEGVDPLTCGNGVSEALFKRQLATPLSDMSIAMTEFRFANITEVI